MAIVSPPLQTPAWTFSTITNNYDGRVTSRKRGYDTGYEGGKQTHRGSNKKSKTGESIESVSCEAQAPHEFLAGDWRFEPPCEDTTPTDNYFEEDAPSPEPIDVEKVMSLLLQALNAQSTDSEPENRNQNQNQNQNESFVKQHHCSVTSPLSGAPDRTPFVRKVVGGPCHGRIDSGLKKWVLCKNHYDDIRAYHPSRRSAEWIEALHEMGWENLHPTYISQSQLTFKTLTTFSTSCDDWIDVYKAEEDHGDDRSVKMGSDGYNGRVSEDIHESVWDFGLQGESRMTTLIAA